MNADSDDSNRKERAPRRPSRVWRTLLGAAIGALLAMSMVPYVTRGRAGGHGYLPIYEIGGKADVNVAQLVLNVSFAALAGALAANLSRRAVYLIAACLGVASIANGIIGVVGIWEALVVRAQQSARLLALRATSDMQINCFNILGFSPPFSRRT